MIRYFLDRSLGSRMVPGALREAGWVLESMDERYGRDRSQTISDAEWIEAAARRDEVIVTSDRRVGKVPLQAETIRAVSARILVVDANLTARDQALRLMTHGRAISEVVAHRGGPWVLSVGAGSLRDLRLL